ncbi:MAG: hypothetical protein NC123_11945 [Butyrivibrio sp.]|nr:hypothetical protein [Ruminococcus flavefaciens]MCM1560233.1 hypothetical protein [Butyrivibrio sp.]
MRITNKIMQKNNLSNINTNKIYQDKLSTQMSTQKKINRPSDDPVVAIRALRLRSSVTEITQYYSKNIPDAESWLSVTEDALKNLSAITTNMITLCTKGANGPLKTEDRQIILEQLKKLGEEVYATGDADYAGRYVFTGYRTDTPLSFDAEQNIEYEITEQLNNSVIDSVTKVDIGKLADLNASNYNQAGTGGNPGMKDIIEDDISAVDVHRIRLAYDDCYQDGGIKLSYRRAKTDGGGNVETDTEGKVVYETVTWPNDDVTIETMHSYDKPSPYECAAGEDNKDRVIYIPETGELLLGESRYAELMEIKDDDTTLADESEIRVTYEKKHWQKGDLRPEHYFYCKSDPGNAEKEIVYNRTYLSVDAERQDIEYDVGYNQTIRVNSTADQCFKHGIGREVDDLVNAIQDVLDLEALQTSMNKMMESLVDGTEDKKILKNQLDALGKALTLAKDKEQRLFENGITAFQGYLDDASLCITECGTRSSKLELIKNRSQNQKTTFETLKSENEDIDITEVAIQLTSADLTYQAALMATGKVSQTTLLNYI